METIVDLERMAAAHWRGTEEEWLGDWLLRAAEGFTGRANSALPLGDPGLPLDEAIAAVANWYRARGLPPMIVVPAPIEPAPIESGPAGPGPIDPVPAGDPLDGHLTRRGWLTRPGPAFVMLADLPLGAATDGLGKSRAVQVSPEPDDAWAARYHYRGQDTLPPVARKVLTSAEHQSFVSIRDGGEVVAIARLSVAGGWGGLTAVEVHPDHRRRRLGTAITAAACQQAERHGASRVFLQVETGNDPAQALYRRLGFRYSHRYHYRVAPLPGGAGVAPRHVPLQPCGPPGPFRLGPVAPRRASIGPVAHGAGTNVSLWPTGPERMWPWRPAASTAAPDLPGMPVVTTRRSPGASARAVFSLRLGIWLPLGPGARLARGASGRAAPTVTTTTMSRPT